MAALRQGEVRSLGHELEQACALNGPRLAIVHDDTQLTFAELDLELRRVARALQALRCDSGDTIASWSPNTVETVFLQCAALIRGVAVVHLVDEWDADRAASALHQTGAASVFIRAFHRGRQYPAMIKSIRTSCRELRHVVTHGRQPRFERVLPGGWAEFLDAAGEPPDAATDSYEPALVAAAAGARLITVFPDAAPDRPLELGESQIVAALSAMAPRRGASCVIAPFHHPAGLIWGCLAPLLRGDCVVLAAADDDPPAIAELIRRYACTSVVTTHNVAACLSEYLLRGEVENVGVEQCWLADWDEGQELAPSIRRALGNGIFGVRLDHQPLFDASGRPASLQPAAGSA